MTPADIPSPGTPAALNLEMIAAAHHMRPLDLWSDPPRLPIGEKVLLLNVDGQIAEGWQWEDNVDWRNVYAFVTVDGQTEFGRCDYCDATIGTRCMTARLTEFGRAVQMSLAQLHATKVTEARREAGS